MPAGGSLELRVLVAAGTIAAVVAGVMGYLVGSAAGLALRAGADSNATLERVVSHVNGGHALLRRLPNFDLTGANPDFARARQTAGQYALQLDRYRQTVEADRRQLIEDRDRLAERTSGLPSFPLGGILEQQRDRVQSMLSALDADGAAVKIMEDQMQALAAAFDVMSDFTTVFDDANRQDVPGALAVFPGLDGKIRAAARLAAGTDTPPQVQKLVTSLQELSTDLNGFLQAVQQGDPGGAHALDPRLQADAAALQTFDAPGLDAYERTLLQPYEDRFDAGVRAAGFTPAG